MTSKYCPTSIRNKKSILAAFLLVSGHAFAGTAAGPAGVIDGDGLVINGFEHRLEGIDAVELDQGCQNLQQQIWKCGQEAKKVLQQLVHNEDVTCYWTGKDKYNRRLSTCFVGELNLNAAMVYLGYAVAYRKYSDEYIAFEKESKNNGNGIWAGSFELPWNHRKYGKKLEIPPPDSNRLIKGNIGSEGNQYFHCPGDRSYSQTKITEAKGERWFVSSSEAIAAGWIRPPNAGPCQ